MYTTTWLHLTRLGVTAFIVKRCGKQQQEQEVLMLM